MAHIHTHDFFATLDPESYVFDVAYDAATGIVLWTRYPSEVTGQKLADSSDPLVLELKELYIKHTSIITPTNPSPPRNLVATAGDNQVSLTWETPDNDGNSPITEYYVYRGSSSGGPYTKIGSTPMLGFVDTSTVNDNTYYYVVTALNAIGESDYSNEASVTPSSITTPTTLTTEKETDETIPTKKITPGWTFTLILATIIAMRIRQKRRE